MLKRLVSLALLLGVLFVGTVFVHAAGTATIVKDEVFKQTAWSRPIRVITWKLLSTDGTATIDGASTAVAEGVTGTIINVFAKPDGSSAPDDDYDLVVKSVSNGADVINGAGANLPQDPTSAENRRMPVDFLNSGMIFLFDEDLYPYATNFNAADTAISYISIYVMLP